MHETGQRLLNLMFNAGESVCVSPNKYGYHSIPLENVMSGEVTLVPTQDSVIKRNLGRSGKGLPALAWEECFEKCSTDNLLLVSLNPIHGYREDRFTTAYRSFLVELDYGTNEAQIQYLQQIGIPYSALVFSGSKSIHCLITLNQDLPSYEVYYEMAEWILNICSLADPNTKNPSRGIRIPGAEREPGKFQSLVEIKERVKLTDLVNFLKSHPESRPKKYEKKQITDREIRLDLFPTWVGSLLVNGFDPTKSRNKQWFSIACEFALKGYSEDDTVNLLSTYFQPDRDFKEKEWRRAVQAGFDFIYKTR